ncbi:type II toxin-antitoxin system RelE/ParE family toxin [Silvimonas iriomotensis]|uniref:Plasmid maintenance system killer protein n=1 Tax=Silvimonas iriomotensis TaxID=449662 RepID=A0ABQ2P968_9NEIS|nr:type II toxin-antitoxin system RelE/ParE family toxin [Silvimonas iriomotensis]GGP21393.1 plasmid maintenance system killer protein [Silvimonas iriomotensis]
MAIQTFRNKETAAIWAGEPVRKLPLEIQNVARRKLRMINAALTLDDLRIPPANRLEPLQGKRSGQYSIRINNQWRICFQWDNGNAFDVGIVDYH